MKAFAWIKGHVATSLSLLLNVGLVAAIVWQAHVIQQQREVIIQLYFYLKMVLAAAGGQVQ